MRTEEKNTARPTSETDRRRQEPNIATAGGTPLSEEETATICRWLETQLHILRPLTSTQGPDTSRAYIAPTFSVGDRVRINNRISLPILIGRQTVKTDSANKSGVIVKITTSRIHIRLENSGTIVQRSPKNITKIFPAPVP
jgi:hypothetical protein